MRKKVTKQRFFLLGQLYSRMVLLVVTNPEEIEIDTKSESEREFNPEASGLINSSF
jgi:hypothetical protein